MNETLVVKLDEVAQNASLPVFGEVNIYITNINKTDANSSLIIETGKDSVRLVTEDANLSFDSVSTNLKTELVIPSNTKKMVYFGNTGNKEYVVKLYSKFKDASILSNNSSIIKSYYFDIDDFKYTKFKKLNSWGSRIKGNISSLSTMKNLTEFNSIYDTIVGDISLLKDSKNFNSLGFYSSSITGNLQDLSNNLNIHFLTLINTSITGSIEKFVESIIKNGKVNGKISILTNNYITLNDIVVGNNIKTYCDFSNTGCSITDKDNSVIATFTNNIWSYT